MTIRYKAFANLYQDSVSLMQLSAQINKLPGIQACSVAMGTDANLQRMQEAGFGEVKASPNDLVIVVKGSEEATEEAISFAQKQLTEKKGTDESNEFTIPNKSIALSVYNHPDANLSLISVPGQYAAAEALKALRLGMNVMMFSDNVSMEDEKLIKSYAYANELMVMGPDCGTAIINGIPLGFANVVRDGSIGFVAASGTGLQEATCRVHQLEEGISQALGTGGHDLHESIGGLSMLTGLKALIEDEKTKVIVLISKPPAKTIADKILTLADKSPKPVVVHFLGAKANDYDVKNIHFAHDLAHSADIAVALLNNQAVNYETKKVDEQVLQKVVNEAKTLESTQQYIRGVFAGGTFCYEAQLIAKNHDLNGYSNTPVKGYESLVDVWKSEHHTFVDLGDDVFTAGKPHPMIDPTLRNQRILQDGLDKETAVILFDVVIGYGASDTPIDELLDTIVQVKTKNVTPPIFIGHVCGTDSDPQNRANIIDALQKHGVIIADCNASAARLAVAAIKTIQ